MVKDFRYIMISSKYITREIHRQEWDIYWDKIEFSNLLQSWEYGEAKNSSQGWIPLRYAIETVDGEVIAIAQILTRTLPFLGGVARLNRGPLLLTEFTDPNSDNYLEVLKSVLMLKKEKRWWLFFIAPEMVRNSIEMTELRPLGLRLRRTSRWGSSLIDLEEELDDIVKNLNGKWRNLLRKAQKSDLQIRKILASDPEFEHAMYLYSNMQKEKNFSGMPINLLRDLGGCRGTMWGFNVYLGELDFPSGKKTVGMVITVRHGSTTTYLIGYSGHEGRKLSVNYLLLFQAITDAQESGCLSFDLGGLNENTPKGVAHFKRGISGKEYELFGELIPRVLL